MAQRLYRSTRDKFIAGVAGGLGEYFEVDPAFIRILFVLLTFASGFGVLAYLILWITVRRRPADVPIEPRPERDTSVWTRFLPGIALIIIGLVFFVHENLYWFDFEEFWEKAWPVMLIGIGLFLVLYRRRAKESPAVNGYHQAQEPNGGMSA